MVPFHAPTSAQHPYGFSLSFQDLTIVAVQKQYDRTWVALAMPGDALAREDERRRLSNFDGTTVEEYIYTGFTAWILLDGNVVVQRGEPGGRVLTGLEALDENLVVGHSISFNVSINAPKPEYQQMNKASFDLLEADLGRPNSDRSDETFRFYSAFAILQPINGRL